MLVSQHEVNISAVQVRALTPMLCCRENTRKLKASGNVLTNLVGSLDGRLFSNIIWRFSLDPLSPGKQPWS